MYLNLAYVLLKWVIKNCCFGQIIVLNVIIYGKTAKFCEWQPHARFMCVVHYPKSVMVDIVITTAIFWCITAVNIWKNKETYGCHFNPIGVSYS